MQHYDLHWNYKFTYNPNEGGGKEETPPEAYRDGTQRYLWAQDLQLRGKYSPPNTAPVGDLYEGLKDGCFNPLMVPTFEDRATIYGCISPCETMKRGIHNARKQTLKETVKPILQPSSYPTANYTGSDNTNTEHGTYFVKHGTSHLGRRAVAAQARQVAFSPRLSDTHP